MRFAYIGSSEELCVETYLGGYILRADPEEVFQGTHPEGRTSGNLPVSSFKLNLASYTVNGANIQKYIYQV